MHQEKSGVFTEADSTASVGTVERLDRFVTTQDDVGTTSFDRTLNTIAGRTGGGIGGPGDSTSRIRTGFVAGLLQFQRAFA